MSGMSDREKAFENKFAHDQELRFKAEARRNKLLGLWAAEKLGKAGAEAEAYAKENGLDYVVTEPQSRAANVRPRGYGENFATDRHAPWTH